MPNRIIRESVRTSLTLDALSAEGERLFVRLIVTVDDHGRFHGDPGLVLAACFPRRIGRLRPPTVKRWLDELAHAGAIRLYAVGGQAYLFLPTWAKHQRRPQSRSKFPDPLAEDGSSTMPPLREDGAPTVVPPSLREVVNREVVNRESAVTVLPPSSDGPNITREQAKANIRRLRDMASNLGSSKTMPGAGRQTS